MAVALYNAGARFPQRARIPLERYFGIPFEEIMGGNAQSDMLNRVVDLSAEWDPGLDSDSELNQNRILNLGSDSDSDSESGSDSDSDSDYKDCEL